MFLAIFLGYAVSEVFDDMADFMFRGDAATSPLLKGMYICTEYVDLSHSGEGGVWRVFVLFDAIIHQLQVRHPFGRDNSQRVR